MNIWEENFGLDPKQFESEEKYEEALSLAESITENGHYYGLNPAEYPSYAEYRERFLPLEEMWNHLSGLFYVYPKDYVSFDEFIRAFYTAGGEQLPAVIRYMGLPAESADSADVFLAACKNMTTDQIREFLREKMESDEEAILRTLGEVFGLDRNDYAYQRYYMADLARASLCAKEMGVRYGVREEEHPDQIEYMMALYQAKKKWDIQGAKYGLDPMKFECFEDFRSAYQGKVKENMIETAQQQGIDIDPDLPYSEYARQWAEQMHQKGLL